MPLSGRDNAIANVHALTPWRKSHITWDVDDTMLVEAPFTRTVLREQLRAQSTLRTIRLSSGGWILEPLNNNWPGAHETTAGQQYVIRLGEWIAEEKVVEVPFQRVLSELTGISPAGTVSASGDYYMTKRVLAGNSWAPNFLPAIPYIPYPTQNYPMDRILEGAGNTIEQANQGYIIKVFVPSTSLQPADQIFTFYFGGLLTTDSFGFFALSMTGFGQFYLYEWLSGAWTLVSQWRFRPPDATTDAMHGIRIIPHAPSWIEFSSFTVAAGQGLIGVLAEAAIIAIRSRQGDLVQSYLHQVTNRSDARNSFGAPVPITGPGRLAIDVRRDIRLLWQVSRIAYPASGTITEYPFTVPHQVGAQHVLTVNPFGYNFSQNATVVTSATFSAQNPDTALALPTASENYTLNGQTHTLSGWVLPGDVNKCQVVTTLASAESAPRYHSPVLYGYEASRIGETIVVSNGGKTGGIDRHFSASGPDVHPDHDTAHIVVSDLADALPILRTRSYIPVRIETEYDALDPTLRSVIFEGYVGRALARRRVGLGVNYPSPNWHDYECDLIGKWSRLEGRFFNNFKSFANDVTAPGGPRNGPNPAWRITDAIRWTLWNQGFFDSQLDIFDDEIQFWFNSFTNSEDLVIVFPGTSVQRWLLAVTRDYLNAFLVWDANASTAGMWRLLRPPIGTETPLWNFVTTPGLPLHLAHKSGAYGVNTSPVLHRETMTVYIVPPEGNTLTVTGGAKNTAAGEKGQRWSAHMENRSSWNAPNFSAGDPTSLDWLGTVKPIEYVDVTLVDQFSTNFVCRRIFNLACRGRKFANFTAELVLVQPTDPVYTTRSKRPLRVGDMVTLDGAPYMVHGCSPHYEKDHLQFADYELELFRSDLTWK